GLRCSTIATVAGRSGGSSPTKTLSGSTPPAEAPTTITSRLMRSVLITAALRRQRQRVVVLDEPPQAARLRPRHVRPFRVTSAPRVVGIALREVAEERHHLREGRVCGPEPRVQTLFLGDEQLGDRVRVAHAALEDEIGALALRMHGQATAAVRTRDTREQRL